MVLACMHLPLVVEKSKLLKVSQAVGQLLNEDLQKEFPGMAGFSRANIFRIKAFYTAYEKVAQPARQIDEHIP